MQDPRDNQISAASPGQPAPTDPTAMLLTFLNERNVPCPLCGYNLRNLTKPRCPECGCDIILSVGMSELYLRAWIVTLVPTLVSAGVGVLIIPEIYMQYQGSRLLLADFFRNWREIAFNYCILNLFVGATLIIWRRRFMRFSRLTQWIAAVLTWLLAIAAFAAITDRY